MVGRRALRNGIARGRLPPDSSLRITERSGCGPAEPALETAKEPLATLAPPTLFLGLVTALDDSIGIVAYGIDGTMWSSQAAAGGAFASPRRIDTGAPRFARGPALAMPRAGLPRRLGSSRTSITSRDLCSCGRTASHPAGDGETRLSWSAA